MYVYIDLFSYLYMCVCAYFQLIHVPHICDPKSQASKATWPSKEPQKETLRQRTQAGALKEPSLQLSAPSPKPQPQTPP